MVLKSYIQLLKPRLASLVLFSSIISYLMATSCDKYPFEWKTLILLSVGGFFVIGSANGFNQIIERATDALMERTQNRPLPLKIMAIKFALLFCTVLGIIGLFVLYKINYLTCFLGFLSWFSYVICYTPLKTKTPFAVYIGAIPGALPYLIGWTAATHEITNFAWILFGIQFFWQFPHFWSIAWVLDNDYKKAGIKLLPSKNGKDEVTTFQIIAYTIFLIIISYTPYLLGQPNYLGITAGIATFLTGIYFLIRALELHKQPTTEKAKKVMFASLIYLPIVQIILYLSILCSAIQICDL